MIESPQGGFKFSACATAARSELQDADGHEYSISRPGRETGNAERTKPGGRRVNVWLSRPFYTKAVANFTDYSPDSWSQTIRFMMTTFIAIPWLVATISSAVFTYLVTTNPELKELFGGVPMDAHVVMGSALSFLVVFRTNSSYGRWSEARHAWQELMAISQGHAMHVGPILKGSRAYEDLLRLHVVFAVCLKAWLRDTDVEPEELGARMDMSQVDRCMASHCPPLHALGMISEVVRENLPMERNTPAWTGMMSVNERLLQLSIGLVGTCKRIKDTPMAFGYVATLRTFLMLWLFTLPLVLVGEYHQVVPPVIGVISFLFLTVEQMAIEIEQPFGDDANDLPLESYILDLEEFLVDQMPQHAVRDAAAEGHPTRPAASPPPPPPPRDAALENRVIDLERRLALLTRERAETGHAASPITLVGTNVGAAAAGIAAGIAPGSSLHSRYGTSLSPGAEYSYSSALDRARGLLQETRPGVRL